MAHTVMRPYQARFGGGLEMICPECGAVCAYWDAGDLDEYGNLPCSDCGGE